MRVRIRAAGTDLESRGLGGCSRRGDDAYARRSVLQPPAHRDRRPKVLDEALVRVDGRRKDRHDGRQGVQYPREEALADFGDVREVCEGRVRVLLGTSEQVLAGGRREGHVHVSAVAGEALDRLRHEARRDTVGGAERFHGVFEERRAVGHCRDLAEFECCFVHSRPRLGVPAFDGDAEFLACGDGGAGSATGGQKLLEERVCV